jgi:hypothetical protein
VKEEKIGGKESLSSSVYSGSSEGVLNALPNCAVAADRSINKPPFSEICKASVMRWPIEQCFEEGKGQLGMDHYEHRSWPAWHRHMIYVFLGLHFILPIRIQFKKTPALTLPQTQRLIVATFLLNSVTLKGAIETIKYHYSS